MIVTTRFNKTTGNIYTFTFIIIYLHVYVCTCYIYILYITHVQKYLVLIPPSLLRFSRSSRSTGSDGLQEAELKKTGELAMLCGRCVSMWP